MNQDGAAKSRSNKLVEKGMKIVEVPLEESGLIWTTPNKPEVGMTDEKSVPLMSSPCTWTRLPESQETGLRKPSRSVCLYAAKETINLQNS